MSGQHQDALRDDIPANLRGATADGAGVTEKILPYGPGRIRIIAALESRGPQQIHPQAINLLLQLGQHQCDVGAFRARYLLLQRARRRKAESEAEQRRAELSQASRLALAGELSASIAHEINQPLGAILANAGAAEALLRRHPEVDEELRAILADIRAADLRASEVIGSVRALVSARPSRREQVDVNTMVREVLAFLRLEAERRGVEG